MKIKFLFFFFTFFFFFQSKVSANVNIQTLSRDYRISTDLTTEIEIKLQIKNTSTQTLVGGYNFAIPASSMAIKEATIEGQAIKTEIIDESILKRVKLDFGSNAIKPSEVKNIFLKLSSGNIFFSSGDAKILEVLSITSEFYPSSKSFSLTFPKDSLNLSFSSFKNPPVLSSDSKNYVLTDSYFDNFILIFGNSISYDVSFENTLGGNLNVEYLMPLPVENSHQKVIYQSFDNVEKAIGDDDGHFWYYQKENEKTGFKSRVDINPTLLTLEPNISPEILIYDGILKRNILEHQNFQNSKIDKLYGIYRLIIDRFVPKNVGVDLDDVAKSVFKKDSGELSSLEYATILLKACKEFDIKCNLEYGFTTFSSFDNSKILPNVWLKADFGDSVCLLDPFSEDRLNINNFCLDNYLSKIKFGIISAEAIGTSLGLTSNNPTLPFLEVVSLGDFLLTESNISIELGGEKKIYSGFFNSVDLLINNTYNRIIKINQIQIDGIQSQKSLNLSTEYFFVALPNQVTKVNVTYRNPDFFRRGKKEVEIFVKTQNPEKIIILNQEVEFLFEPRFALTIIFLISILLLLGIVSGYTFLKRRFDR